jgi:hypothetical protein
MDCIVLLKAVGLVRLTHQDDDRANATEGRMTRSFVGFPCRIEARQAIEECRFIDDDLVTHDVSEASPMLQGLGCS